jgi:hypothetical protein
MREVTENARTAADLVGNLASEAAARRCTELGDLSGDTYVAVGSSTVG